MAIKYALLYGSARKNRQGIKGAKFVFNMMKARGWDVTFVDASEYNLPFLDKMYKEFEEGEAPDKMRELAEILANAGAFMIVTGEYNHSIPPVLKNMLDHFQREYYFKPAAISSYSAGIFGGVRAAVHLRQILGELGMVTMPSIFPMLRVGASFDEDGNPIDDKYPARIQKMLDELEWYAKALNVARKDGAPY